MINGEVDLRNINGECNLASALGVDPPPVGGLWKILKREDESARTAHLRMLARRVATDFEYLNGAPADEKARILARNYGISPKIVVPLIQYNESRTQKKNPGSEGGWYFNS